MMIYRPMLTKALLDSDYPWLTSHCIREMPYLDLSPLANG